MKKLGIYGLSIPEEYGGDAVSMPCYVLVTEELARGWMSLAGAMGDAEAEMGGRPLGRRLPCRRLGEGQDRSGGS